MSDNLKKTIYSLHPLERKILPFLEDTTLENIVEKSNIDESEVNTSLQLLEQKNYLNLEKEEKEIIKLDTFGEKFVEDDLPEVKVLKELGSSEKAVSDLDIPQEIIGAALGELKKNNLVETRKEDTLYIKPTSKGEEFLKNSSNPLKEFINPVFVDDLNENQKEILKQFEKRKGFIKKQTKKKFHVKLNKEGRELVKEFVEKYSNLDLIENLTTDMLKTGEWKGKEFRHYDTNIPTSIPNTLGRRHPMLEANEILTQNFLEMGFKEMKGPLVESAFWNMDVMWIPQDHPARDEQDTFYLEGDTEIPDELSEKVKKIHENGIKQTHTSKDEFSFDISKKKLLRTHSTATSFRMINKLAQKYHKGEEINGKYFYVANVFRNEAIDATHLAEFYQGEGFIIGDDLSLGDLMGFVREYLNKLGFDNIYFKPTFNPYTQPSMEAHVYDEEIGKSYALINSGIFRPETLKPFGLENKRIIAWGFGASRIAAKLAGKTSMREITGTTCDLEWMRTRPIMSRKIKKESRASGDSGDMRTHTMESQEQGGYE